MVCSLVRITLAVIVFGPLLAYRATEFCLHGCVSVAVVLAVVGGIDYCYGWTVSFIPIVTVILVGVCSYIELAYQALGEPVKIAPRPIAEACWRDWQQREAERLVGEEGLRRRTFSNTTTRTAPRHVAGLDYEAEAWVGRSTKWRSDLREEDLQSARLRKLRLASKPRKGFAGDSERSRGGYPGSGADTGVLQEYPVLLTNIREEGATVQGGSWNQEFIV
ncbi:unnamed protein product [Phytophthora fragariaefolia]|uniref:Unnamed protein product n=1 Tax=Phytophthora fragariaefolia TaxID=1490495 RepID=A0A9W6WXD1_9STRA|nr:unnamed protein product [Phytophthora fragariaefolia]